MHGSPPPHCYILGSVSTFKCDGLSALKTFMQGFLSPHHYILGSVQTFRHNHLSALGTFMCSLPHIEKCQKFLQNRLTHSGITPIQLLRQLYESPINQDILMVALDSDVKFKILSLTLWFCHKVKTTYN